jgi:hypothetical protein
MLMPRPAQAQAPPVGPLVLTLPATPRTAALGNAWVAGRDQEVLFYNPAQLIGARQGMDLSVTRYGSNGTATTLGSTYAAGKWSLTLGWGVQYVDFSTSASTPYPYATDVLLSPGDASGSSALIAAGGAITYKGLRIGAAGKYAVDRMSMPADQAGQPAGPRVDHGAMLVDVGVSRALLGGTVAVAMQNMGNDPVAHGIQVTAPKQLLAGYARPQQAGPLDLNFYSQLTVREGWTSVGGGFEMGYSWLEGYYVSLRVGARRTESPSEQPLALGAAFTLDRITVEYGVQFFDGGRAANGVTIRWR